MLRRAPDWSFQVLKNVFMQMCFQEFLKGVIFTVSLWKKLQRHMCRRDLWVAVSDVTLTGILIVTMP